MLKPITIPRGVANIFLLGLSTVSVYTEQTEHRPDKLMDDVDEDSMRYEILSNYLSVISPISATKGKGEVFPMQLFDSYFGR